MDFVYTTWFIVSSNLISFILGSLIGGGIFDWVRGFLPWTKRN